MSFNIEWGGAKISFENVVEAIRRSGADIVGIQEAEGNLQRLAGELGWNFDLHNYVISRYPLIAPAGSDGRYVYAEVEPGRIVAIANVHLPSDPYGPDAVRDGATPAEVVALEKAVRLPAIEVYIEPLRQLVADGIPVFITGDFNAPAHSDWTKTTAGTRKFLDYALEWPVSKALEAAGFSDSWRAVYSDPVRNPGLTWWAARPPLAEYVFGENDAQDRIDFIWFSGQVQALSSELAGESGGPEVSIGLTPWPSDHRAVISGFLATPAELPEFVTSGKRVYQGDSVIDIHANSSAERMLAVIDVESGEIITERRVTSGRSDWLLPVSSVAPGHYQVRTQETQPSGPKQQDSGPAWDFWVLATDAEPVVEVSGTSFEPGETIEVRWRNAPGNRNDYLAAYPSGVVTNYDNGLAWAYTGALPGGVIRLDESTAAWGWPLAPGDYVIRLVKDDGFEVLDESAPFTVR